MAVGKLELLRCGSYDISFMSIGSKGHTTIYYNFSMILYLMGCLISYPQVEDRQIIQVKDRDLNDVYFIHSIL